VRGDIFWPYKRWAVKAMVAQGRHPAVTVNEPHRVAARARRWPSSRQRRAGPLR
jgi:hypothetical protein